MGVSRGTHSDVSATTAVLFPPTPGAFPRHCYYSFSLSDVNPPSPPPPLPDRCRRMGDEPKTDDTEARITSMVQGAIDQRLGSLVNQLAPLVTQVRTSQRSTGGKSTRSVLCMPLLPPTPSIRKPTRAFVQGAYVLGP